jgi:hypothetical protein
VGNWYLCVQSGVALAILYIVVECPCYNKDHVTFHLHSTLCDMLGEYHCSVSNVLVFLNRIGLARSIFGHGFRFFRVLSIHISLAEP